MTPASFEQITCVLGWSDLSHQRKGTWDHDLPIEMEKEKYILRKYYQILLWDFVMLEGV